MIGEHLTVQSLFDEKGHAEPWRNGVARELNELLARAEYVMGDPYPDDMDRIFTEAVLSICERVACFEEIQLKVPALVSGHSRL
jgi:hypothetical protein